MPSSEDESPPVLSDLPNKGSLPTSTISPPCPSRTYLSISRKIMEKAAAARFFSASSYAVVGSFDPSKFGYKVLTWYLSHSLPIQPIHSTLTSISVPSFLSSPISTMPSISSLPSPSTTSLSIITPPPVTLRLLAEAKEAGIHSVFLQPGTYDEEVEEMLEGDEWWKGKWVGPGSEGRRGKGGWCVLVDGEDGLGWAEEKRRSGKGKL